MMKELFSSIFICAVCVCSAHQGLGQTKDAELNSPASLSLSPEAIDAGIGGQMTVGVKVNPEGRVKDARVLGGPSWPCGTSPDSLVDEVQDTAVETIKQVLFSPAMKNGKAVSTELFLTIDLDRMRPKAGGPENGPDSSPRLVKSGVINGRAKSLPKPAYPPGARSMRITGPVAVYVRIGTDGTVKSAGAISGHPQLVDSARDAACAAKFVPVTLEGKPIEVTGVLNYIFN